MAKYSIETSLLGRRAMVARTLKQIKGEYEKWVDANPEEARRSAGWPAANGKIAPARYEEHGGDHGVIVGVFIQDGKPKFLIETGGDLLELSSDNFDILP